MKYLIDFMKYFKYQSLNIINTKTLFSSYWLEVLNHQNIYTIAKYVHELLRCLNFSRNFDNKARDLIVSNFYKFQNSKIYIIKSFKFDIEVLTSNRTPFLLFH